MPATTFNIGVGTNLITYDNTTPTTFASLNPTVNIKIIKTPAYDTNPPYANLQSYIPQSSLNRWLTQFEAAATTNVLSSYLVDAKVAFSFTPTGDNITAPETIQVTSPWGIFGLDSNRQAVPVSNFTAINQFNPAAAIYRAVNGSFQSYVFGSALNSWTNFEPGYTYYVYTSARNIPWQMNAPRARDLLLTDSGDFINTESGDVLSLA